MVADDRVVCGYQMSQVDFVRRRLQGGDKIKFCRDYYGQQWIELRRWWLLWPKTRVSLTAEEASELQSALRAQRRAS
jgi:hypothetical protein